MTFDVMRQRIRDRASGVLAPARPALSQMQIQPPRRRKWPWIVAGSVLAFVVLLGAGAYTWYTLAQRPVDPANNELVTVRVESGLGPSQIGTILKDEGLIRDELAYRIYVKLHKIENTLKAGTYKIAPSETMGQVIAHLLEGRDETFTITFYPGATLYDPTDVDDTRRTDAYTMLARAGYSDEQIRAALATTYDSPLFQDKPVGTSLEGYIYGETYQFPITASVADILNSTFTTYYDQIQKNDIVSGAAKHGLNLYQAITLASIVQREVSGYDDMRKVAQVFYSRLEQGMTLGSDVTFIYAAQQANQTPTVTFDSPYNTRINAGLPPGPIATPGIDALRAVADPADTSYLYFVAGDDGKTYFSYTEAEHQQNVAAHCGDLCK